MNIHFPKQRFLLFLLLCCLTSLCRAQAVDSTALKRELGNQYLERKLYAEAYSAFRYCIDHTSAEDKTKEDFSKLQKSFYQARNLVESQLNKIYKQIADAEKKGQREQAYILYQDYLNHCVTPESKATYEYSDVLTRKAVYIQREGRIQEAIQIFYQVLEVRRNVEYLDYVHSAETLNLIAAAEQQLGHYDEAIKACTEAAEIYKKRYGSSHEHYGTTLSNLAGYHTSRNAPGDREYAVHLGEMACKMLPKKSPAYAHAINNLVLYYSLAGDMVKAEKLAKDALISYKKLEKSSINYAAFLSNQAIRLANANNFAQATRYARGAIILFEENGEDKSLNFARLLSNTATFEKRQEHYKEAIELWQKALPIYERIEGKGSSGYLDCMSEISAAHSLIGNLEKAADINTQIQATASSMSFKGDAHFAHSLTKRASIMAAEGNYNQAILLEQQALAIFRYRKDVTEEASSLNDLSNYLYRTQHLKEAVDTCQKALALYENVIGHEEDRALALNNLSIYYNALGQKEDALATSRKAVAFYDKAGNTQTTLFAKVLTNLALYEAQNNHLEEALNISLRADSLQRRILGEMHPDNVLLMFNTANFYILMGKLQEAQRLYHEALTIQMHHVRANFSHLSTRGRELYWGTKDYIFQAAPYMACLMEKMDSARVDAYNALLFKKGILLNSEVDFRNLLARTASAELQEKYAEMEAVHQEIEKLWKTPSEQAIQTAAKLTDDYNRLERELIRGCKEYGDFTEALNITYQQVMNSLDEHDAAIEFFDIVTSNEGLVYWALLSRKGWDAPHLIRLFSQGDLENITSDGQPIMTALQNQHGINAIFEDKKVGKLVWGNLMPQLKDVENIWFSPSGILYQWGIEYLRYDQKRIGELFNIHRVSSTKLLAQKNEDTPIRLAAVFGGFDYDATATELQLANQQMSDVTFDYLAAFDAESREDMAMAETRTVEGLMRGERKEVGPLPGTAVEVALIGEALMQKEIDTEMYEGVQGTEEAFKRLSGRQVSLLHIATHGFSLAEADVRKDTKAMHYLDANTVEAAQADNSLCYSGLLMSGANIVLGGNQVPSNLENGVLTAREIAQLDFRGLSLAVLSACQTGLGEVKEDGVFGLQRGLKKAGARTLLMSLWSVDDDATQMMMTHFYNALANGLTRRNAFHTAQETLRNNPRFSSPYYWASFVMLDD